MERKQPRNSQLARERVVYDYLEALDDGDIDGIIGALQQAVYDAPLDGMLIDAHQAYFQDEQARRNELADTDTSTHLPALTPPRMPERRREQLRRLSWWARSLAAVLLVGILIGSFVTLLALRHAGTNTTASPPTPGSVSCYPLKTFSQPFSHTTESMLRAVSADAVNDAWAVGYTINILQPQGTRPLIEHWDGYAWQVMSSPANKGVLEAVIAISTNNVWAVGTDNGNADSSESQGRALIEHWDGQRWSIIVSPETGTSAKPDNGILLAITAVSANDVWTLGSYTTNYTGSFVEHWDGKRWTIMSEFTGQRPELSGIKYDIQEISAQNVWATVPEGFEHWDGSRWTRFSTGVAGVSFGKMSVISANDIWTLGRDLQNHPLLAHWNGQRWSLETAPQLSGSLAGAGFLIDMVAVSDSNIWALGYTTQKSGGLGQIVLLMHWDGKRWQQVNTPALQVPSGNVEALAEAITVYAGRQLWIVGGIGSSSGEQGALIEGQLTCP